MTDTEELLRLTFERHADDAPLFRELRTEQRLAASTRWRWLVPSAVAFVTAAIVIPVSLVNRDSTTVPMTATQVDAWIDEACAQTPAPDSPSHQTVVDMDVVGAGVCQWQNAALNDPSRVVTATQGLSTQQTEQLMSLLRDAKPGTPDCLTTHDPRDSGYFVMLRDPAGEIWRVAVAQYPCAGFTLGGEPYWATGLVNWLEDAIQPPSSEGISVDTLRRMEQDGLHASMVGAEEANPSISLDTARQLLNGEGSRPVTQISLVRITVDGFLNHNGERTIDNRLAWIGLVPDAPNPCFGGPRPTDSDGGNTDGCSPDARADWIVIIDATTGDFLQSRTL